MPHHPPDLLDYFCIHLHRQKLCSHLISHTYYIAPTTIINRMPAVFIMCISAHLHYINTLTIPKHLMLLRYSVTHQYSDFITNKEENGNICAYAVVATHKGACQLKTGEFWQNELGVKPELVEVVTLSVIKDLEKATHGKSWEFTF